MGTSIKCSPKITIALCVAFFFSSLPANAIPTAEDINGLAETARLDADTFMRESFQLRMQYEFSGTIKKICKESQKKPATGCKQSLKAN
jgi:hypothetical protein